MKHEGGDQVLLPLTDRGGHDCDLNNIAIALH